MQDELRGIARRVQELEGQEGAGALVDALRARYAELSGALGGGDLASTTSTIDVTGSDTNLFDVDLATFLLHTFAADLDMPLTSPSGTVVVIGTDNGAGNDDVYDPCLFDDAGGDTGSFAWAITVTACPDAGGPVTGVCFGDSPAPPANASTSPTAAR